MCYTRALGQYSAWENSLRCPRTRTLSTPTEMSLLCVPLCTSLTRAAQQPAGRPVQTMLCDAWRQCRRCGILRPQPARFECVFCENVTITSRLRFHSKRTNGQPLMTLMSAICCRAMKNVRDRRDRKCFFREAWLGPAARTPATFGSQSWRAGKKL